MLSDQVPEEDDVLLMREDHSVFIAATAVRMGVSAENIQTSLVELGMATLLANGLDRREDLWRSLARAGEDFMPRLQGLLVEFWRTTLAEEEDPGDVN